MHSIYHENNSKIKFFFSQIISSSLHTLKPNAIIFKILSTVNRAVKVVLAYVNTSLYVWGLR